MASPSNHAGVTPAAPGAGPGLDTPILFMVFNRPDLARRVFAQIRAVRPRRLFFAADGPRMGRAGETELCRASRRLAAQVDWPCDVQTLFRDINLGAKGAVSSALTWFFEHVEAGIILEDDCLPDPSFFTFCAELLERYRNDERILSISGSCFQPDDFDPGASYYFSLYQHVWGWATWRRAWQHYEPMLEKNPCVLDPEWLTAHLGSRRAARYWAKMLALCVQGRFDAWDYPWLCAAWVRGGLSLIPARNLVTNIGFDARATHTHNRHAADARRRRHALTFPLRHPTGIQRQADADHAFERTYLCPEPPPRPVSGRWRGWRLGGGTGAGAGAGLNILRRGLGCGRTLVRLALDVVRRAGRAHRVTRREERRLQQLQRYRATETPLLGRSIRMVDAPSFLVGRHEIFERKVYDFEAGRIDPLIIDCGANIGLSVIFFKQRYPAARLLAFEPDPQLFQVLEHNVRAFGLAGVTLRPAAVWTQEGSVPFCREGGLSGRLPKGAGDAVPRVQVPACRLRDVLAQEPVDLLKMDIEGAEAAVLGDCRAFVRSDWIRRLFVEYHSHMQEPQVLHELLALLAAGGYRYHVTGAFARKRPFVDRQTMLGMDLQLNIYAYPDPTR